ncbi:putative glycosyltransferase EpsJ [Roseivivax jejudonensis]|uniref:Putative glycosyltransferase EpsJ n=1 Tax=Roseivivax jejudonensis TaxID=1529041 RepID=A0A1X6YZ83_9RHOB|nr:glycosyltransferase [Roseivivax jejudonensis]SLN33853.1 putative glycosyltransferase EpsJ [Roseivivax jejudonensis]
MSAHPSRDDHGFALYRRFLDLLAIRQADATPEAADDFRAWLLSRRTAPHRIGFRRANLETGFSRNMAEIFPELVAVDEPGIDDRLPTLMYGAILDTRGASHASAVQLMPHVVPDEHVTFFEMGFLASATSWSESLAARDPSMACLGYVYDDKAQFFMADYPNRLTDRLNGDHAPSAEERARAERVIDRIVAARISKYNSQPFFRPPVSPGHARRVLVVDQNHSDASTFYGRASPEDFAAMLDAAVDENPDAEILVKTHPDLNWTRSGRRGYFDHLQSSGRVRLIRDNLNPFQLFDLVDTVYVGTSGMGLEALLAGKRVVCFGAPFYAGWGLTDDRRPVPHRHRTRDLLDLFHTFYIWYTIYALPGGGGPAEIEDVLDFIEEHRPVAPLPAEAPADPMVSIVVPVHGVEAYVADCLASIQRQSLRDFEVIAIDDVSPDRSAEIVAAYAADDPRITLLRRTENAGPGFVRNQGIEAARGRYVLFIDPDDIMPDPGHLERIVAMAEADAADMVRFRKRTEQIEDETGAVVGRREDKTERQFPEEVRGTRLAAFPQIAHSRHFWNWLYRRDFLDRNAIRFRTAYREERAFLVQAYMADPVFSVCDSDGVTYRIRQSSAMRRAQTMRDVIDQLDNFDTVVRLLAERGAFAPGAEAGWFARFQVSQFLHYLFFGFAYKTACAEGGQAEFLDRLAGTLDLAGLGPDDLVSDPVQLSVPHLRASAYGLMLAAVRARRPHYVETALRLARVPAHDLWREFQQVPADDRTTMFQVALGTYARNERVETPPAPATVRAKKPRIVLHLGASKTGSTALQHRMDRNRAALLRAGIWFPETHLYWQKDRPHKQGGHGPLLAAANTGAPQFRAHLEAGIAHFGEALHTIVLSSEGFFLDRRTYDLARYLDDYEIEAIVYLRRQDAWANAQYSEFASGGTVVNRVASPVGDWLAEPRTRGWLDYARFLSKWSDLVGRENLTVRIYDRPRLVDGDLTADFAEAAGLPALLESTPVDAHLGNAARLSGSHVELLRIYNGRRFNGAGPYLNFIEEAGRALVAWRAERDLPMPRPWVLSETRVAEILDATAEGNRWIGRTFFGTDADPFPEEPAGEPGPPLHPEELALVERIYREVGYFAVPKAEPVPAARAEAADEAERPAIEDHGPFAWRRWLLTPAIRAGYRARTGRALPETFEDDPAGFVRQRWSGRWARLVARLYSEPTDLTAVDPVDLRIRLLRPLARRKGGDAYVDLLERDPVQFARTVRNPALRAAFRLVFPRGELARRSNALG